MAKIVITLEDQQDNVTLSMDMGAAPTNLLGALKQTAAVRMSQSLFDMAAVEAKLNDLPACRRQPPSQTIH